MKLELPHRPAYGVALGCFGAFFFTLQDAAFKWLTTDYAILQIIFLRCFLAIAVSVGWIWANGGLAALQVRAPRLLALSLVTNMSAWYCFYTGLSRLPLTIALCVFFLTPVVIALLSVALLNERLSWRQIVALLCGLLGVFVITNPLAEVQTIDLFAVPWILASVVLWASTAVITRALESAITVGATLLYHNVAFLLVSAALQPWYWQTPATAPFVGMLLLGVLGVFAQGCMIAAYRAARAAVVATSEYSGLAWAVLLGWLIWNEQFGPREAAGVALIVSAGLIVLNFKRKKRKAASAGDNVS